MLSKDFLLTFHTFQLSSPTGALLISDHVISKIIYFEFEDGSKLSTVLWLQLGFLDFLDPMKTERQDALHLGTGEWSAHSVYVDNIS